MIAGRDAVTLDFHLATALACPASTILGSPGGIGMGGIPIRGRGHLKMAEHDERGMRKDLTAMQSLGGEDVMEWNGNRDQHATIAS